MAIPHGEPAQKRFDGGLNTTSPATSLEDNELQSTRNMRGTSYGSAKARKGYTKVNASQISTNHVGNIINFQWSDGTDDQLITIDTQIRKFDGTDTFDNLSLPTTITADKQWDGKVLKDFGFMVSNGAAPAYNFRFDGTNIKRWGIKPRTSAPTLNTTINGSLTAGDYQYKITVRNSLTGSRSTPSAASANLTAGSDPNDGIKINLNIGTVPADEQNWDQIEVWRTEQGPGGYFYLDGTIDSVDPNSPPSTYDSICADTDLGDEIPLDDGLPPKAQWIEVWDNRVFLLTESSELYWSKFDSEGAQPESFNNIVYLIIGEDDGDIPTGLIRFGNGLVVFKESHVYFVYKTYDEYAPYAYEALTGKIIGPKTQKTIAYIPSCILKTKSGQVSLNKCLLYQGVDGQVYAFNGSESIRASDFIETTLLGESGGEDLRAGSNLNYLANSCAIYDPVNKEYKLSISYSVFRTGVAGNIHNNVQLALDTTTGAWWPDTPGRTNALTYPGITVASYCLVDDSDGVPRIWAGESQDFGWVYNLDIGEVDNSGISGAGTAIDFEVWTGEKAFGESRNIRVNQTKLVCGEEPTTRLYCDLYFDGEIVPRETLSNYLYGTGALYGVAIYNLDLYTVQTYANLHFKWSSNSSKGIYRSYRLRSTDGPFDLRHISEYVSVKGWLY